VSSASRFGVAMCAYIVVAMMLANSPSTEPLSNEHDSDSGDETRGHRAEEEPRELPLEDREPATAPRSRWKGPVLHHQGEKCDYSGCGDSQERDPRP
jgi:hypothetical protein